MQRANTCGQIESKPCVNLLEITADSSKYENSDDFSKSSIAVEFSTLVNGNARIHSINEANLKKDCEEGEWCRQTWNLKKDSKICETSAHQVLTMRTEEDPINVMMHYESSDICHEMKSIHAKHVPQDVGELVKITRNIQVGNIGAELTSLKTLLKEDEVSELARVYHVVFIIEHNFSHEDFRKKLAEHLQAPPSAFTVINHRPGQTTIRLDTTDIHQWLNSMQAMKTLSEMKPLNLELSLTSSVKSNNEDFIANSEQQGFEVLTSTRRKNTPPQTPKPSHREQSMSIPHLIFYQLIFVIVLACTLVGLRFIHRKVQNEKETKFL